MTNRQEEPTPIRFTETDLRFIIAGVVALVLIIVGVIMLRPVFQQGGRIFMAREAVDLMKAMRTSSGATLDEGYPLIGIDPVDDRTIVTAVYSVPNILMPDRVARYCADLDFGATWEMLQCEVIDDNSYQITVKRTR